MAHTVFICHSAKDKLVADAACAALEAHRIPCWIAPRDVLGGTEWGAEIVDAIAACQVVVLIFSGNANASEPVRREVELALNEKKIVVPFRIEDIQPSGALKYALLNRHWLDAITPPVENALNELCRTIFRIIERSQPAQPLWGADSRLPASEPVVGFGEAKAAESIPAPVPIESTAKPALRASKAGSARKPYQRYLIWFAGVLTPLLLGAFLLGKVWDPSIRTIKPNGSEVDSVTFSPDGQTLVYGGRDNTLGFLNTSIGKLTRTLQSPVYYIESVAFSHDGRYIASGSSSNILWDVASGKILRYFDVGDQFVWTVAFSPDGRTLATGSSDGTINLWDTAAGKNLSTFHVRGGPVFSVAFSPDGRTLASGSGDSIVQLWDTATGKAGATLRGHSGSVWSVAFSPDGRTLASGSEDKTVRLWDVATGQVVRTLQGHAFLVRSVAFSPDGRTLASGSDDKTIKLWDVATHQLIKTLHGHRAGVRSVAFSPDGRTLASGSQDTSIKFWNVAPR